MLSITFVVVYCGDKKTTKDCIHRVVDSQTNFLAAPWFARTCNGIQTQCFVVALLIVHRQTLDCDANN